MGGQATAAVAAAEAVLQEATTAVAKQLQRAIPEAQNLFSEEDAGPANALDAEAEASQEYRSAQPSDSEDSEEEVQFFVAQGLVLTSIHWIYVIAFHLHSLRPQHASSVTGLQSCRWTMIILAVCAFCLPLLTCWHTLVWSA